MAALAEFARRLPDEFRRVAGELAEADPAEGRLALAGLGFDPDDVATVAELAAKRLGEAASADRPLWLATLAACQAAVGRSALVPAALGGGAFVASLRFPPRPVDGLQVTADGELRPPGWQCCPWDRLPAWARAGFPAGRLPLVDGRGVVVLGEAGRAVYDLAAAAELTARTFAGEQGERDRLAAEERADAERRTAEHRKSLRRLADLL